ncbi:unnamed protein product [Strongylus vulgaris]|uniref:G-patch domain-containing protein n=1 Tax=Strongylus vulgaris TaxID=40348 RepID=A0A3P7J8D4_STRVU|nr:unnamed protein product [Strongylus vulgaris]
MVEEDDGMEAFDFDERDLEFALNPGGRRHFQTKNQATYGGVRPPLLCSSATVVKIFSTFFLKIDIVLVSGPTRRRVMKRMPMPDHRSGMRTSAVRSAVDPNASSDWTKYGKGGVVKKMMEAMGYKEGEGLGASRQGIVEPVQAAVRKGRGAIGAYGKEAVGPRFGETAADAQRRIAEQREAGEATEEVSTPQLKTAWKKASKVKTRYKTLDEVIEEGGSIGFRSAVQTGVKVIDMTGPEQRVYSGYDSFSMKNRPVFNDMSDRENFDVPELMHNLNLLVDLTEESIRRNDHQLKTIKDRTTALEYDLKQAKEMLESEERASEKIKEVYDLIEKFSKRKGDEAPSINDCQALFTKLRTEYKEEYHMFNIEALAVPLVLPQISEYFSKWRPLDPDHLIYGVDLMKEWRDILVDAENVSMFTVRKETPIQIALVPTTDFCGKDGYPHFDGLL